MKMSEKEIDLSKIVSFEKALENMNSYVTQNIATQDDLLRVMKYAATLEERIIKLESKINAKS